MRRITLIFALLLSLMGVRQANAETLTANFNSGLPEGWSIVGDITNNSDRARGNSGKGLWTYSKSSTDNYVITEAVEGTFEFYARAYNKNTASEVIIYEYTGSGFGTQLYTTGSLYSSSPSWSKYSFTVTNGTQLAIVLNYAAIDDVTYTQKEQAEGPALTVYDGTTKLTSPYSYDFGLTTSGTTKEFTLKNPGTATLGVSISAEDFEVSPTTANISAGGELTLKVTMPDATANDVITITPDAEDLESFVINVSGTVRDENKLFIDFADGTIPTGWTSVAIGSYASSYGTWSASEGYVSQSGSSSSYEWAFQSPKLNFTEGETLLFQTSKYSSSTWYTPSIKVEYSEDGSTWTTIGSAFTDDVYGTWTQRSVNIPTADAKYIRFSGWYVNLTNIYGGELPMEPNMVVTASDYNFGNILEETSTTFTIKNSGRGELNNINVESSNSNYTITGVPEKLAYNESAEITITLTMTTPGEQDGIITVSAPGQEDASFNVSGYVIVIPDDAFIVDFNDNKLPTSWENQSWTFADGAATGKSSSAYLTTPVLEFAEGDAIFIKAKRADSDNTDYITIQGSNDNGETWTAYSKKITGSDGLSYPDYSYIVLSDIPATINKLRFVGFYVTIDEIIGLTYDQNAPVLAVSLDGTAIATGYADNFGKVKAAATHTYTIKNAGTGTLEVSIASDSENFTVTPSTLSLAEGAEGTFDVTLVFNENYGEKSATISVVPSYDETAAVVINATATTSDPNVWEEDFEGGTVPARWIANGWTVTNSNYGNNGPYMLAAGQSTTVAITPRLYAEKDQVLTFEVGGADSTDPLTVKWASSNDAAEDEWNLIGVITTTGEQSFTAPETGFYYISFQGKYSSVDNFEGFKLDLPAHEAAITATTIPATGTQFAEYTASVTVKEQAGKSEELTAKFFIGETQYGEDVVETVNANGTKTFTVTFTPEEATSGDAYFTVTNADITLTSEKKAVEIAPAPVLDETAAFDTELSGNFDALVLKYTPKNGWNTICVPFALTDDILTQIFGEGWKAYEFKDYNDGEFTFYKPSFYAAGYPYLVFTENAPVATDGYKLENINITAATALSDNYGGVTFHGTYAPMAAGTMEGLYGVVPNTNDVPTIMKGGASATLKGYRGYFEIPSGEVKSFSFTFVDDATGIRQFVATPENGAIYDLNGNKVKNLVKGQVYIMNGQKILVK